MPQPNFDPVRPAISRRYQSSGMSGSPSNWRAAPLIFSVIIRPPECLPAYSKAVPGSNIVIVKTLPALAAMCLTCLVAAAQQTGPALSIDANAGQHAISPDIYGINFFWNIND